MRQPLIGKHLENHRNGRGGLARGDGKVGPARGQADEDALGTLLDEVAAQTSAVVTGEADLDNLFGDLGLSEAAGVPAVSSEYSLNPDAFDAESNEQAAGGGNDSADAEALAGHSIDDFELLSELGEDSDLSELLGTTSNFLSSEDEGGDSGSDRYLAAGIAHNEEIGSVLNMTSNSDLDISTDGNWLEDAFDLEDESVQSVNLDLDDTDLDALFGDMTSGSISGDDRTVRDRQGVATSREAADLAELFGSVPTGTEYDGEASGQAHAGWLNLDGGSELLSAGVGFDEGGLGSLFSNNAEAVSDNGLANLAAVELGALSDPPDSFISSVESDDGAAFDLLEDMLGEGMVLQGDAVEAPDEGAALDVEELSGQLPEGLLDEVGADLFDEPETEAAEESSGEDDLFDALETDF